MGQLSTAPSPAGDYDVVVVGSGPGGLQTAYWLQALGVRHAVLSADEAPGGMFRKWPVFQRLLSWSKPDAPFELSSRRYEWFDHNSLLAEEPAARALVPQLMDRTFAVPSRAEMEAGLAAFAERTALQVRYGCRWEATRRDDDGRIVLETTGGAYRCRAAVFALGVTEPWKSPIPGIEQVPHYAETRDARDYAGKRVLIVGKRNSGFEIADALLPWARQIVLASPSPPETAVLARTTVRARYLQPLEDGCVGGGTFVFDGPIERIERSNGAFTVLAHESRRPGAHRLEADAVIAATGFRVPLRDLPALGVVTVSHGRLPALNPFFESTTVPGIFFAGNATQGAPGLRKRGVLSTSSAVAGFRYNARVLAEHLACRMGAERPRPRIEPDRLVSFLLDELEHAPELWAQKGYLARVVTLEPDGGGLDEGILPLERFVDEVGPDAVAVAVELDEQGTIFPAVYLRRDGSVREIELDPDPFNAFAGEGYRLELEQLLGPVTVGASR